MTEPIECRTMAGPERFDAFALMRQFRTEERLLGDALSVFADREDYGFVWLAYREDSAVGCCSVGYAIAADAGGIVATVRDLYVVPAARRSGVASALLAGLEARLAAVDVKRIEVAATAAELAAFLAARGYAARDERLFTRDR